MAITMVVSAGYPLISFIVDLSYSLLDPRVRLNDADEHSRRGRATRKRVLRGTKANVASFVSSSRRGCSCQCNRGFFLILAILAFVAFLSNTHITTFDPLEMHIRSRLDAPNWAHRMGTDQIGLDVVARVVAASWISPSVSVGILAVAGRRWDWSQAILEDLADEALMRLTDLFLAVPALILAAAIAASFRGGNGDDCRRARICVLALVCAADPQPDPVA